MKIIKKNVYYCEFCNKRGLSAYHSSKHEKGCTNNPDRVCKMCQNGAGSIFNIREIVAEYKKRFTLELIEKEEYEGSSTIIKDFKATWIGNPITIEEVRKRVDGCPNCMLAIIRQCKFSYHYFEDMGFGEFDYKKEMEQSFRERHIYDDVENGWD